MKKLIWSVFFVFAVVFSASAQVMPAGASDKSLEDRNVKNRSIELERTKRDAEKPDKNRQSAEPTAQLKFAEIKEDFEKIQNLQNGIIDAYTKSKQIDYAKISGSADEMNKSGTRLKGNLFAALTEEKKDKKSKDKKKDEKKDSVQAAVMEEKTEPALPTDVKTLIVELDNTLMAFTGNPMFTSPQTVNAADNAKAKADLERIIRLSAALKLESDKMAKPVK